MAVLLFTKLFYHATPPEFDPPEIHAPLSTLVLQTKQICSKMGGLPSEFLSQAIDPPLAQMELALKELASLGAIVSQPGSPVLEEAEITLLVDLLSSCH